MLQPPVVVLRRDTTPSEIERRRVRVRTRKEGRTPRNAKTVIISGSRRSRSMSRSDVIRVRMATCNNEGRATSVSSRGRKEEERKGEPCVLSRGLYPIAQRCNPYRGICSPDCLDLISISRNSMITKDRESVRRRARIIFISNWIHGGGSEGLSLS